MCKWCGSGEFINYGYRLVRGQRLRRHRCKRCQRTFSGPSRGPHFSDRKPQVNRQLFYLLCAGVSQRRCALLLRINRETVARKIRKYAPYFRSWHESWLKTQTFSKPLLFDEMETFEHTKCKPLSIPIAVEEKSRFILGLHVASIPAKGKLAKIARKRYGRRENKRHDALTLLMNDMKAANATTVKIKSDKAPVYPKLVKTHFPKAMHLRYKGRRGCVVGQGELKAGGHDPLFYLNHNCAMIRDNLKRLSRRTWCTSKKPEQLQNLLNIYMVFHNRWLGAESAVALPGEVATLLPTAMGAS